MTDASFGKLVDGLLSGGLLRDRVPRLRSALRSVVDAGGDRAEAELTAYCEYTRGLDAERERLKAIGVGVDGSGDGDAVGEPA